MRDGCEGAGGVFRRSIVLVSRGTYSRVARG